MSQKKGQKNSDFPGPKKFLYARFKAASWSKSRLAARQNLAYLRDLATKKASNQDTARIRGF